MAALVNKLAIGLQALISQDVRVPHKFTYRVSTLLSCALGAMFSA